MSVTLFSTASEVQAFCESLAGAATGWRIEHHASVASTNELAVQAAHAGTEHGRTFTADEQTEGRGRRGRSWLSPHGKGLLFSTVARGAGLTPERLGWVALTAGLACSEAIRSLTGIDVRLKWPNDLVVLDAGRNRPPWRKLGGILVESSLTERKTAAHAVIGVGVNVLHELDDLPGDARTPPTSLLLLTERPTCRRALLKHLLEHLAERILWVTDRGDFIALTSAIRNAFGEWWSGWEIRVGTATGERQGFYSDLDAHGRLCLQDERGRVAPLADAEWLDARSVKA